MRGKRVMVAHLGCVVASKFGYDSKESYDYTLEKRLDQKRVMDPCMADVFVLIRVLCRKSCLDSL